MNTLVMWSEINVNIFRVILLGYLPVIPFEISSGISLEFFSALYKIIPLRFLFIFYKFSLEISLKKSFNNCCKTFISNWIGSSLNYSASILFENWNLFVICCGIYLRKFFWNFFGIFSWELVQPFLCKFFRNLFWQMT